MAPQRSSYERRKKQRHPAPDRANKRLQKPTRPHGCSVDLWPASKWARHQVRRKVVGKQALFPAHHKDHIGEKAVTEQVPRGSLNHW